MPIVSSLNTVNATFCFPVLCVCVYSLVCRYIPLIFFAHFPSIFVGYFYVWIILFSLSVCKCVYFYFVFRLLFTTYYLPILYLLSTLSPLICFALFCVSCEFSFLLSQCGCLLVVFFFYNITNIYAFFLLVMTLNIKMGIFWEMGRKYTINNRSFLHDFGDLSTIKKS